MEVGDEGAVGGVMNLCQEHRDAHRGTPLTKRDKQIGKREEHRPKARMDHCALMEVLYYALYGIPCGRREELTELPTMIRVMEGHEVFGPLQLRRIDLKQEMFKEEEGKRAGARASGDRAKHVEGVEQWTVYGGGC